MSSTPDFADRLVAESMRRQDQAVDTAAISRLRKLTGDIVELALQAAHIAETVPTVEVKANHFRAMLAAAGAAWEEIEAARQALPLDLARRFR